MSPRPLLVIPEIGKEALKDEKVKPYVEHPLIRQVVVAQLRKTMYGPGGGPTMRERLLMWTSSRAIMTGKI